ncbi:Similar to Ras-related protein RSR1; acc. no. P13856 [Pyronema omphalodes CBS 100304]|uniref:Similar to Ras-related protein RSR1 acc. no. P13856 n=1 Tax=Pyronema omphalodes (strain CBS 100304) TaxID=1076935 RepID=U4LE28_PYROM|nr:Similar to Ras-related protein RSR1; acc. no. P13856 [Pyronema omphalodes CBS 100304]
MASSSTSTETQVKQELQTKASPVQKIKLHKCHVLMLGAKGTGKSCLSSRFATSLYSPLTDPTIDDVPTSSITFDNTRFTCHYLDVKSQQWDLLEGYVSSSDAVMLIYSVTDRDSLEEVRKLGEAIRKLDDEPNGSTSTADGKRGGMRDGNGILVDPNGPNGPSIPNGRGSKLPIVVIGTMKELDEERVVEEEEGRGVARGLKCGFWEVSAATGENCERVQEALCRVYLARFEEERERRAAEDKGKDKGKGKQKRGCVIL